MTYKDYDVVFEQFLLNIALTKTQSQKILDKLQETAELFASRFSSIEIYTQGSYAMGTVVKPLTEKQSNNNPGDYDVDIVLERVGWENAADTLSTIRNVLSDEYGAQVDRKLRETCERVYFTIDSGTGVGFHTDYVPIKKQIERKAAKRSENKWFNSDTKLLVTWFESEAEIKPYLRAMILIIKRARDVSELNNLIPSVVITALVVEQYEESDSYAEDLINLVESIKNKVSVRHNELSITIPVIDDDLAGKFNQIEHATLITFFEDLLVNLSTGLDVDDEDVLSPNCHDTYT